MGEHFAGGFAEMIRLAYDDLRRMARHEKRRVFSGLPGMTRQTTDIVHEVFEELRSLAGKCRDGDHFYGAARLVIRHFLIDYARQRQSLKRGVGRRGIHLDSPAAGAVAADEDRLPLEYVELMDRFTQIDPRACEAFSLCDLGGFKQAEAAGLMGVSVKSIERDLAYARAWWRKELTNNDRAQSPDDDS